MNIRKFSKLFPFGSHLCREPMPPMSELKHDMEVLKKAGFNLIKLQEHWSYDEPEEGKCDFSKYEELIDYAGRLDMGVYLGLTCEQAPVWLYQKHPGCRMVQRDGLPVSYAPQTTFGADAKPGPCFDNPVTMACQERFLRQLVKVLGKFENLVVWNTWQEITSIEWSKSAVGGQEVCFCPHTVQFFREWLAERYGDLDGVNRAWKTRIPDWGGVVPEHAPGRPLHPQALDWHYFMENAVIARSLRERCRVVKEADPLKRPVFAHRGAPQIGSGADWAYAKTQDFLGSSCYPAVPTWSGVAHWDDSHPQNVAKWEKSSALLTETAECLALRFDYIRSCNGFSKPVWAAEFQGGPGSHGFIKRRTPSEEDIRRWLLMGLGAGVTGVSFWVARAEIGGCEADGFSLLDSEGDASARFEEAARIGRALNKHADLFGKCSSPRAEAAILVNERNYQLCASLHSAAEHLKYSTQGWHRMLWESGLPVDFLELSHAALEDLKTYKCLILPVPLCLSEEIAGKLAAYVESGGSLVSEACCGKFDESSFCPRGELSPTMRELFGVRHRDLSMLREPGGGKRWTTCPESWGMYMEEAAFAGCGPLRGRRLRANVYRESFECIQGEPVLMHRGEAVGAVNKHGAGNAWLLGTFVGHNGLAYRDKATWEAILSILRQCGVSALKRCGLIVSRRVSKSKEAWIFFNPAKRELSANINVKGWRTAADLLGERLHAKNGQATVKVKSLDVKAIVVEGRL